MIKLNQLDTSNSKETMVNRAVRGKKVMEREYYYRWEWHLKTSPASLWSLVTDTNRFNRDTGLPAIERRNPKDEEINNARRKLRFYRLGIPVEWEEEPFEWVRPYRYGVVRHYTSGPVAEMRTLTELKPQPDGGTHLVYEVWAVPSNLLGLIAIPAQIGLLARRSFGRALRHYDRLALQQTALPELPGKVEFTAGGRRRLAALSESLTAESDQPEIVARLVALIESADDASVSRIRPYEMADLWTMPRRAVLEVFLLATRRGLLEMHWEVLCPLCRNPKHVTKALGGLGAHEHCEVCHIDFDVNFEQSVEVAFRPNPSIRETERGEFCIAGPQTTPHVVVQQLLAPGAERIVNPVFETGRYRLRTLSLRGGEFFTVSEGGLNEITLRASRIDGWSAEETHIAPEPELCLKNVTDEEQLFILERMAWGDDAATAAEVTALQAFRDLFANEALRPGEQISVGSLTIVFTDLRGSTRLYREIGDAPAFGVVMNHFDVLRDAISAEGGAVVKTIGDSVMAIFRRPAPAMRALLHAQHTLAQAGGERPLHLRAGIHYGPCIAVTLNERLDYFGSTVNLAARLEGLSSGGDVVISDAVLADPEVHELLNTPDFHADGFHARLKGFEDDAEFALWRVTMAAERQPLA
jgi:class 3 adenylate cyclase